MLPYCSAMGQGRKLTPGKVLYQGFVSRFYSAPKLEITNKPYCVLECAVAIHQLKILLGTVQ